MLDGMSALSMGRAVNPPAMTRASLTVQKGIAATLEASNTCTGSDHRWSEGLQRCKGRLDSELTCTA